MMYGSVEEFERAIKKQFLDSQGRPIESHPAAFLALRMSVTILGQFLHEAQKSGEPQVLRSDATGEMAIICYPSGKIKFFEESTGGGFQVGKTEMAQEERVRLAKMKPIDMDDVLDIHRLLRDYDGDLLGMVS